MYLVRKDLTYEGIATTYSPVEYLRNPYRVRKDLTYEGIATLGRPTLHSTLLSSFEKT